MRRMLLAVFAVAAFGLSAGTVWADQTVVCSPGCGVVHSQEVEHQRHSHDRQNLKENEGKDNAGQHMSQKGLDHNNAGIGQPTNGGSGNGGGTIMIVF